MTFANATPELGFIPDTLNWVSIGTEGAILASILALLCALIITRKSREVRVLLLPILLTFNAMGLYPGMPAIIIAAIVFLHASLSAQLVSTLMTNVNDIWSSTGGRVLDPVTDRPARKATKLLTQKAQARAGTKALEQLFQRENNTARLSAYAPEPSHKNVLIGPSLPTNVQLPSSRLLERAKKERLELEKKLREQARRVTK